MVTICRYK